MVDFQKTTAFVTRLVESEIQLLVFQHPLAGIQVPAGSVEGGEDPGAGALRETEEETGLKCRMVAKFPPIKSDLGPRDGHLTRDCELLSDPDLASASSGLQIPRGWLVKVTNTKAGWVEVCHEKRNYNLPRAPVIDRVQGWVRATAVAHHVTRFFFHLVFEGTCPERWVKEADGHVFEPHWLPLSPTVELVQRQKEWLRSSYSKLLQSAQEVHQIAFKPE